jgi:hypothetical protein
MRRSTSKIGGTRHEAVSMATAVPFGKDARRIVGDAAAGNVRGAAQQAGRHQRPDRLQITAMHLQQRVAHGGADLRQQRLRTVAGDLEEQLARQRISIGVQTGGRQREQHVARAIARPVSSCERSAAPTMKPARSYSESA